MNLRARTRPEIVLRIAILAISTVVLISCTSDDEPEVTSEPTAAPTTAAATAAPGQLSVGELTGRINDAWGDVDALRVTSSSGPTPIETSSGTPAASGSYAVETWIAPNNRAITEIVDGTVINQHLYKDGVIYMKGIFVSTAVAPEVGSDTWITIDEDIVPRDTPVGNRIAYLTREPASPFARMSEDMLLQPVTESGTVQVNGRSCTLYTFGDPNGDGNQIRYEIALDENDLPCQVVQRAGGFQNSSVYEINSDGIEIVAPDAGTPVSGTPEG
jgi:hypothetical protein